MKIEFDPIADALYIELADGNAERTEEIVPGVILDYDASGNVMGIEMLYIGKRENAPLEHAA